MSSALRVWRRLGILACAATAVVVAGQPLSAAEQPNILLIMCDDVGFSDIGCYGGEIPTPNLDKLAEGGVRFTQFYNMARCCPSRASLMTGLYPHQAGVGHMLHGHLYPGYGDQLSSDSVTIAEVLQQAGYSTYMTGKWHLGKTRPTEQGFERFYGIWGGAANYFDPSMLARDGERISSRNDPQYKPENYYFTDAITDNSIKYLTDHKQQSPDRPFFMYVAYTAAHWPIQAPEDEIAKHKGKYDEGYDAIRRARFEKMKKLGIIRDDLKWSETVGEWSKVENKDWEKRLMEVYAAMLTRMDTGIGKIVETLKSNGELDNTIVMFLQDNGGCAEEMWRDRNVAETGKLQPIPDEAFQPRAAPPMQTRDGRPIQTGPEVMAGPDDTYLTYGKNWANVSNTPFREYKHWVHEGGISTPLIVHWPNGIKPSLKSKLVREPSNVIDVMATALDAAETSYPKTYGGSQIAPLAGKSLLPLLKDQNFNRGEPIFWEHENNRAVRDGKWKAVTYGMGPWELYDMEVDRAEQNNLAEAQPERVKRMTDQWQQWAESNDVLPLGAWEKTMKNQDKKRDSQAEAKATPQKQKKKPGAMASKGKKKPSGKE